MSAPAACRPFVIVAVGLRFEARLAGRCGRSRVCCGHGEELLAAIERAIEPGCAGILSYGIAGGLDPRLRPGQPVVASAVIGPGGALPVDQPCTARLMEHCHGAANAAVMGADGPVLGAHRKRQLFAETGAAAIDMESHIAAAAARRHGLPFAVLRVIADPAHRTVPQAALAGMRPDGSTNALGVVGALMRRPSEMAGVMGVAFDVWAAWRALTRLRDVLEAQGWWEAGNSVCTGRD